MILHSAQKKGCHDRRFQQGLGSVVRGQTDLRPLVRRGVGPAHQLPRNACSVSGLSILPAGHSRTPCASTFRQQVRGVIHKSQGRPRLEATLHAGERPSCVGSRTICAHWWRRMCRAKWTKEQTCCRGTMSLQRNGRSTCSRFRKFGKSLADNSLCPIFFTKSTDALAHEWPSLPLYAFPPVALLPKVLRRVREQRHKLILISPLWRNQALVSELFQLLKAAPWPIPLEMEPPLSSEWHNMASTARVMGPACVAARWEPFVLPESVLNTMAKARAPSTRCLYMQP